MVLVQMLYLFHNLHALSIHISFGIYCMKMSKFDNNGHTHHIVQNITYSIGSIEYVVAYITYSYNSQQNRTDLLDSILVGMQMFGQHSRNDVTAPVEVNLFPYDYKNTNEDENELTDGHDLLDAIVFEDLEEEVNQIGF